MSRKRRYTDDEIRQHIHDAKERYYGDTRWAKNGYTRWTAEEVSLLDSAEFTDQQLARELERSVMAVQVKRSVLKRYRDAENNTSIQEQ